MVSSSSVHFGDVVWLLRRPPVLFAGSLVIAGSVIATNALFMQPRRHPAPLVFTRDVSVPQPPAARPAQRADDLVLAVQQALRRVGYYSGPLDGMTGPKTKAAIVAFEQAAGREQKGEASLELLAAIKTAKADDKTSLSELVGGEPPVASPAPTLMRDGQPDEPVNTGSVQPDARIAAVQHALSIAAYGPVKADGIPGPETEQAIMRFQRDHGLPPTGEISDSLMVELRAVGALEE